MELSNVGQSGDGAPPVERGRAGRREQDKNRERRAGHEQAGNHNGPDISRPQAEEDHLPESLLTRNEEERRLDAELTHRCNNPIT